MGIENFEVIIIFCPYNYRIQYTPQGTQYYLTNHAK